MKRRILRKLKLAELFSEIHDKIKKMLFFHIFL
jgi:hypothetical protein